MFLYSLALCVYSLLVDHQMEVFVVPTAFHYHRKHQTFKGKYFYIVRLFMLIKFGP